MRAVKVFTNSIRLIVHLFYLTAVPGCVHEGVRYRDGEQFTAGPNQCKICTCINKKFECDESRCKPNVDNQPAQTPVIGPPGRPGEKILFTSHSGK